jgi:hypothetical protein
MSIRAHRIIEIKLAEVPSFNLWHNTKLVQFLDEESDIFSFLNTSGTGEIEISVKVLKKAINSAKKLDIDSDTINSLQEDIDFAKSKNNDYVIYDCF